jgi:hypothetical protein
VEKWNEKGSFDPFNNIKCDECTKNLFTRFFSWQIDHPLDTISLKKVATSYLKNLTDFRNICKITDLISGGKRIISGINNFIGIGIVGLFYVTFM